MSPITRSQSKTTLSTENLSIGNSKQRKLTDRSKTSKRPPKAVTGVTGPLEVPSALRYLNQPQAGRSLNGIDDVANCSTRLWKGTNNDERGGLSILEMMGIWGTRGSVLGFYKLYGANKNLWNQLIWRAESWGRNAPTEVEDVPNTRYSRCHSEHTFRLPPRPATPSPTALCAQPPTLIVGLGDPPTPYPPTSSAPDPGPASHESKTQLIFLFPHSRGHRR
ncbi:hypothetical protein CPB86DRAFT_802051 [Serendipita vermifera]|nr:hypothetical protein CPB86DRAFT_802051 [Serendipita vermifera]